MLKNSAAIKIHVTYRNPNNSSDIIGTFTDVFKSSAFKPMLFLDGSKIQLFQTI